MSAVPAATAVPVALSCPHQGRRHWRRRSDVATLERALREPRPWRPASTTWWTATCRSTRPACCRAAAGAGRRFPAGAARRVRAGDRRRPERRVQLRLAAAAGRRAAAGKRRPGARRAGTRGRRAAGAGAAGSDAGGEPPHLRAASIAIPCARRSTSAASIAWSGKPRIAGRVPPLAAPPAAADGAGPGRCLCRDGRAPACRRRAHPRHRPRRGRAAGAAGPRHPAHHPRTAQAAGGGTRGGRGRARWSARRASSDTVPAALEMVQDMRKVDQLLLQLRQRQAAMPGRGRDNMEAFREALRQPGVPRRPQGWKSCTS